MNISLPTSFNPTSKLKWYIGIGVVVFIGIIILLIRSAAIKKGKAQAADEYVPIDNKQIGISLNSASQLCADVKQYFDSYMPNTSEKEVVAQNLYNLSNEDLKYVNNLYNKNYKGTNDSFFEEIRNDINYTNTMPALLNRLKAIGITK